MDELINKLTSFGFTKTDALVYVDLLKNGRANGYKIAKSLGLARSSVYSSIDTLYTNGYIFMIGGTSKEYEAKSPELILSEIKKKTLENLAVLNEELSALQAPKDTPFIYNLSGYENLLLKAKELINESSQEIYLNTDFNLSLFDKELSKARERGVRIICFSFNRLNSHVEGVEIYCRTEKIEDEYPSRRFMMVTDNQKAMVFSNLEAAQGIYTNENLLVRIISEHIHGDIYLAKLAKHHDFDILSLNTTHEQRSL